MYHLDIFLSRRALHILQNALEAQYSKFADAAGMVENAELQDIYAESMEAAQSVYQLLEECEMNGPYSGLGVETA